MKPIVVFLIVIGILGSSSPVAASQPTFNSLHPGQFQRIEQNLQINIVFVGYHQGSGPRDINETAFRSVLPQSYSSQMTSLQVDNIKDFSRSGS